MADLYGGPSCRDRSICRPITRNFCIFVVGRAYAPLIG